MDNKSPDDQEGGRGTAKRQKTSSVVSHAVGPQHWHEILGVNSPPSTPRPPTTAPPNAPRSTNADEMSKISDMSPSRVIKERQRMRNVQVVTIHQDDLPHSLEGLFQKAQGQSLINNQIPTDAEQHEALRDELAASQIEREQLRAENQTLSTRIKKLEESLEYWKRQAQIVNSLGIEEGAHAAGKGKSKQQMEKTPFLAPPTTRANTAAQAKSKRQIPDIDSPAGHTRSAIAKATPSKRGRKRKADGE